MFKYPNKIFLQIENINHFISVFCLKTLQWFLKLPRIKFKLYKSPSSTSSASLFFARLPSLPQNSALECQHQLLCPSGTQFSVISYGNLSPVIQIAALMPSSERPSVFTVTFHFTTQFKFTILCVHPASSLNAFFLGFYGGFITQAQLIN